MLQQTQVTTVVPYYERFLKSFPTLDVLNQASLSRVLTLWSGLGYYRRAENLKKCARELALNYGGRLPADHAKLKALPGVGAYTAGALMSIAFNQRYPAVDGNVRRVLGRLLNTEGTAAIAQAARRLVPRQRPGDFNQALMELGATVCTPAEPRCRACPLAPLCRSRQSDVRAWVAPLRKAKRTSKVLWPLIIVRRAGRILLRRRAPEGMLARLWELPGAPVAENEDLASALEAQLRPLNCDASHRHRIGQIRHTITNKNITAPVFLLDVAPAERLSLRAGRWRWFAAPSLRRQPVSSMTLKALQSLAAHEKSGL
jgi:A/G-specific adenine glycosylase